MDRGCCWCRDALLRSRLLRTNGRGPDGVESWLVGAASAPVPLRGVQRAAGVDFSMSFHPSQLGPIGVEKKNKATRLSERSQPDVKQRNKR